MESGQFDADWYVQTYPDVAALGMSPAEHYLWIGRSLGRHPKPSETDQRTYTAREHAAGALAAVASVVAQPHPLPEDDAGRATAANGAFDRRSYLLANPDLKAAGVHAWEHWRDHGKYELRRGSGIGVFADRNPGTERALRERPRICLLAPVSSRSGLGTAARGYAHALGALDIDLEVIDLSAALCPDRKGTVATPAIKPDITIVHQNADAICNIFRFVDRSLLDDTYVIGIWVCELLAFDTEQREMFAAIDEVWTPSAFCAEAVSTIAPPGLPIRVVPHLIDESQPQSPINRKAFGIPEDAYTFLYSFDVSSSIERKNPHAVLGAFREAFADDPSAFLVIKYHSARRSQETIRAIRRAYASSNILFLDSMLTSEQSMALKQAADCLVSPHRAEGFGLNIAEMMTLGKPVIVTGYSGNLEFCTSDNSILLPYRLTEVTADAGPYPAGRIWADPDHDALTTAMREVRDCREFAHDIGQIAARTIRETLGRDAITSRIGAAIKTITDDWSGVNQRLQEGWVRRIQMAWRHPQALSTHDFRGPQWPTISVIVPVYNIAPDLLKECVDSVLGQSYPFWELCLCDDASTRQETIDFLESLRATDQRIRVRRLGRNGGISAATNAAVEMASGSYIAFLDNDDTIELDALEVYARAIVANPGCAMLYCDEDKIDFSGNFVDHYFKPAWSPEHLESCMYVLHMLTVRKQLFLDLGGYRTDYSGAQDYDLALRIARGEGTIVHIPHVLYHWRMIPGSASAEVDAKPTALINARRALEDYALQRYGKDARVDDGLHPGLFRIRRGEKVRPPVTLVILTNSVTRDVQGRGTINLTENFLRSIVARTEYDNYTVLIASDGDLTPECRALLAESGGKEIVYRRPGPRFNFADKANFSVLSAESEYVVLLNDDMEVRNDGWLGALMDLLVKEDVGVVGANLAYPDDRFQHVGMVLGVNETTAHIYHGHSDTAGSYNSYAAIVRNYSAVTGACLATRRSIFEAVGGLDVDFATDYNDTDYCLKVRRLGYRVVYTPFARLYHFENQSFERKSQDQGERERFLSRWGNVIRADPYYNPNLRRDSLTFEPDPALWPVAGKAKRPASFRLADQPASGDGR